MTLLSRRLLVPSRSKHTPSLDLREATEAGAPGQGVVQTDLGSRNIRRFGVRVLEAGAQDGQSAAASGHRITTTDEIREASALFGWERKKKQEEAADETQAPSVRTFGSDMVSEPEEIDDDFVPEPPVPEEERVVTDDTSDRKPSSKSQDSDIDAGASAERDTSEVSNEKPAPVEFFSEAVSEPEPLEDEETSQSDSEADTASDGAAEETEAEAQGERASMAAGENDEESTGAEPVDDKEDTHEDSGADADRIPEAPDEPELYGAEHEELGRVDMSARDAGPVGEQVGPETDLSEEAQDAIMAIEGNQAHALSASHGVPLGRRRRSTFPGHQRDKRCELGEDCPIDVDELAVTTVDMDWPDRRKSIRLRMSRVAGYAPVPKKLLEDLELSDLPWQASATVNFSSGGALMELDEAYEADDLLVLHLDMGDLFFPPFALGRVSFSQKTDDGRYRTGLMFITDDDKDDYLPAETVERLPGEVFDYEGNRSRQIETTIAAWKRHSQSLASQEDDE